MPPVLPAGTAALATGQYRLTASSVIYCLGPHYLTETVPAHWHPLRRVNRRLCRDSRCYHGQSTRTTRLQTHSTGLIGACYCAKRRRSLADAVPSFRRRSMSPTHQVGNRSVAWLVASCPCTPMGAGMYLVMRCPIGELGCGFLELPGCLQQLFDIHAV